MLRSPGIRLSVGSCLHIGAHSQGCFVCSLEPPPHPGMSLPRPLGTCPHDPLLLSSPHPVLFGWAREDKPSLAILPASSQPTCPKQPLSTLPVLVAFGALRLSRQGLGLGAVAPWGTGRVLLEVSAHVLPRPLEVLKSGDGAGLA